MVFNELHSYLFHDGNKYLLLSCAILGIIIYVTSLSVIHVFILLNKVKSNQIKDYFLHIINQCSHNKIGIS